MGGSRRQWGAEGRTRDGVRRAQPRASDDGHSPEPELPPGGKGSVPMACYTNTVPTTQRPGPSQCGPRGKPPTYVLDSVQVDSEGTLWVRPNSGGPGREARPSLPPTPAPRQRKQQTRRLWAPHSQPLRPAAGRGMFRSPRDPPSGCPAWAAQALLLWEGEQSFSPGPGWLLEARTYPLTSEWRFYPVPGHTPG